MPKVYSGTRGADANTVTVRTSGSTSSRPRALRLRLDLFNHSPTGFEWGYGGSGLAQLALAILAEDQKAVRLPPNATEAALNRREVNRVLFRGNQTQGPFSGGNL